MADRERVIKGLEKCKRYECDDCTEKGASQAPWDCPAYDDFVDSAIALLKEQEPVEPIIVPKVFQCARCGKCGQLLYWCGRYCHWCGQAVKWE